MDLILLIIGLVLLFLSGNWLVTGSVQIARYFKVSSLIVGLTIVAFGTSAPELFVSLKAAFKGAPDISLGNVVGSNISNIGVVLGIVALLFPIKVEEPKIWRDWLVMLIASGLLILFSIDLSLSFYDGLIMVSLLIIYLLWTVYASRKSTQQLTFNKPTMSKMKAVGFILLSVVGLYFGSDFLIEGARSVALDFGLSERVVGITIVAFGTSVPELITSLMAVLKKENEISIGNIIGSNIFNIFSILGITSLVHPIQVNTSILSSDYYWMVGFSILLLLVILPLRKGIISRYEGLGLIAVYGLYVYLLF